MASNSPISRSMTPRPRLQKSGPRASRPNGASSSEWCLVPPARSMISMYALGRHGWLMALCFAAFAAASACLFAALVADLPSLLGRVGSFFLLPAAIGLVDLVLELKRQGVTIVTIEHNMQVMMQISDRILALYAGRRIAFGLPGEVRKDAAVVDAYLGGTPDAA